MRRRVSAAYLFVSMHFNFVLTPPFAVTVVSACSTGKLMVRLAIVTLSLITSMLRSQKNCRTDALQCFVTDVLI